MAKPSIGTISRAIWDEADRLTKVLGRPAARSEFCGLTSLSSYHPKTVSTQFGAWKRAMYPELDGRAYKPGKPDVAAPLPPQKELVGSRESIESAPNWARLLKNGFTYLSDWRLNRDGELEVDRDAPNEPGVYAFVLDDEVVYVGVTQRTLHSRLADYRRGHIAQKTSSHLKGRIINSLRAGQSVRVLVATPENSEWCGLPVVTSVGLETGLIRALKPKWNRQGK